MSENVKTISVIFGHADNEGSGCIFDVTKIIYIGPIYDNGVNYQDQTKRFHFSVYLGEKQQLSLYDERFSPLVERRKRLYEHWKECTNIQVNGIKNG